MTGLLHRLAARANGTAWSVRSDARLPFATEGLETAPTLAAQAPQTEPLPLLQPAAPTSARPVQAAAAPAAVPSMPTPPSRLQQAPWQAPTPAPSAAPPAQAGPLRSGPEPLANDAPPQPPATHAIRAQQEAAASLAKPLAPGKSISLKLNKPAGCTYYLLGKFSDDSESDNDGIDLCKERSLRLTE